MTKTEALKLTLEELFAYQHLVDSEWGSCRSNEQIEIDGDTNPVITALKEVLAQPEQEPNGYVQTVIEALYENGDPVSVDAAELLQRITAQPEQKSTADMMMELADRLGELPDDVDPRAWEHLLVYAPKREWVGLTGGDMDDITSTAMDKADAMLLTEAKLKEKNT